MNLSGSCAPAVLAGAVGTPPLLLQQGVVCRELVFNDAGDVVLEETRLRAGALQLQLAIFLALSGQSPDIVKRGAEERGVFGGCGARRAPHLHVDEHVVLVDVLEVLQVVVEEEDEFVHSLRPLLGPAFAFKVALEV